MKERPLCLWLLAALLSAAPLHSIERLVVGQDGESWLSVREESERVSLASDSIWIWNVEPDQNLSPLVLGRGGSIVSSAVRVDEFGQKIRTFPSAPGLDNILDADAGTVFNPDSASVPRDAEIVVDLGGVFRVNHVRFFPRLDSGHRDLYMQAFELGYNRGGSLIEDLEPLDQPFNILINAHPFAPNEKSVVYWPRTDEIAEIPEVRYLRIKPLSNRHWEIAELEIYTDGTVPSGEFLSRALEVRNASPVWGRLRVNGGDIGDLPIVVQTRTGPDPEPLHYYVTTHVAGDVMRVERIFWERLIFLGADVRQAERGPVVPNPNWSPWETVSEGLIPSPPMSFIQFRVRLLEPGTQIEQLTFEFTSRPLAQVIEAEIDPVEVETGEETDFVLSMQVQRLENRGRGESGFRYIEVLTPAEVVAVDSVLVQDREVYFTVDRQPGKGFILKLLGRVLPRASFVQIFFRGRVFVDGTPFQVRALDVRSTSAASESVYQYAREGDVDPLTAGGNLSVRLSSQNNPLVDDLEPRTSVFTPNGDGVNDFFELGYSLFKLTREAPVFFEIFDLSGRRVRQGYAGGDASGRFVRIWDGRDRQGKRVLPGLYLYEVRVQADAGVVGRQGGVNVVY